jgi:glucosamine-6-phosphate deaminase
MNWIGVRDYEAMSRMAAQRLFEVISGNLARGRAVRVGLATGNTMIRVYGILADLLNTSGTGLADFHSFNLDEYVDDAGGSVAPDHPLSYRRYMAEHFSNLLEPRLGVNPGNMFFPDPERPADYDAQIEAAGGLDFQLLGIGFNGHIAFNEPVNAGGLSAEAFAALPTRVIELDGMTVRTNADLTAGGDTALVPHRAVTMGMKPILGAKEIMLLACFREQAAPLAKIKAGEVSTGNPASFLLNHPAAQVVYTTDTIHI